MNPRVLKETKKLELNLGIFFYNDAARDVFKSNSNIISVKNLDFYSNEKNSKEKKDLDQTKNHNSLSKKNNTNRFLDYFIEPIFPVINKRKRYKIIKEKLKKTISVLVNIFKNINLVESDFEIDEGQIKIIYLILKKKFFKKNCFINNDLSIQNLKNIVIKIKRAKSVKRVEEMNKFIFKLSLKKLKKNFFKINNLSHTKENENFFYEYYLKNHSKDNKKQINYLIEFLNCKKKFNTTFFKNIFKNEKFKNDFMNYLDKDFYNDYLNVIERKFVKMLKILKHNMLNDINDAIKYFLVNFIKKKRIKFPWSSNEVAVAISHFKNFILSKNIIS